MSMRRSKRTLPLIESTCVHAQVLLASGATLELQDALGRSALMFAAGNSACSSLVLLLDAGVQCGCNSSFNDCLVWSCTAAHTHIRCAAVDTFSERHDALMTISFQGASLCSTCG